MALATCLLVAVGCKRPPALYTTEAERTREKSDAWAEAARKLGKDTDFATCQSVLRALNEAQRTDESIPKPTGITPEQERLIADVPLSPEDREEIGNWAFSSHDPAYLEECLYLRDVAQSLKLPNVTPERLADLAFAWVCRSVALAPAPLLYRPADSAHARLVAAALPPEYVLRRGMGTALERMYVFLALLQQLDLDGCLIGPANAGEVEGVNPAGVNHQHIDPRNGLAIGGPARPFWAVGVRLGSDIVVYDPWRSEAFPANLRTLQANPDAHSKWFDSRDNLSGVTPDDVKSAKVYLAVPVNALSVRMAMLSDRLKEPLGTRLSINPSALRAAFPDPKPTFWNPPRDRFAYGRAARTFLPLEKGGYCKDTPDSSLFEISRQQQMPQDIIANIPELGSPDLSPVLERLFLILRGVYARAFVDPPIPRERIQRGQFQDAIRDLVAKQDVFRNDLERLRSAPNAEEQIRQWLLEMKHLYENLYSVATIPDRDAKQAAREKAETAIDAHWRDADSSAILLVNRVTAPICQAETVYLLAVCKHEMAERAQIRADFAAADAPALVEQARLAWDEARRQWQTYDGFADIQRRLPGRAEHVRRLKERAEQFAAEAKK